MRNLVRFVFLRVLVELLLSDVLPNRQRPHRLRQSVSYRWPLRHRERKARAFHGGSHQGRHSLAEYAVHLQGLIRQSQPHLDPQFSRPRARGRLAHSEKSERRSARPRAHRRSRDGMTSAVAEVADVLQIPAFLCRQTDLIVAAAHERARRQYQEGPVRLPLGHEACGREVPRGRQRQNFRHRARLQLRLQQSGRRHAISGHYAEFAPVVFDATHSVQLPSASHGDEDIPRLAAASRNLFQSYRVQPSQQVWMEFSWKFTTTQKKRRATAPMPSTAATCAEY